MMIGKILVPVTGGTRDGVSVAYALAAAQPFRSHVVAMFVQPDLTEALALFNEGMSGMVVDDVVKASQKAAKEARQRIEATLEKECSAFSTKRVEKPERAPEPTLSFREVQGDFGDQLTEAARVADLVVFGPAREGNSGLTDAFVQVLVQADRPVLLASEDRPSGFAKRIAIGWDGKNAAAQAVREAIPYLRRAKQVEILSVQRGPADPDMLAAVREYLLLHEVECSERMIDPGSKPIGNVLLEGAQESGADLLVIGGYGHSRLRESLMGGVTRHIVSHATIPVFMVH